MKDKIILLVEDNPDDMELPLIHKKGILDEGSDFLLKPVSPKELPRKVREVLDRE